MIPISEGQERREQLANKIDPDRHSIIVSSVPTVELREIAAELRKTCATCKFFMKSPLDQAVMACSALYVRVPNDGSGFCYRHEPPPASPQEGAQ